MKSVFEGMPSVVKSLRTNGNGSDANDATTTDTSVTQEQAPVGWRATVQKVVLKLIPSLSFLWFGGMIMGRIEGWKWTDSVYYTIITGSTIGFVSIVVMKGAMP